jgi:peroxiredoxin
MHRLCRILILLGLCLWGISPAQAEPTIGAPAPQLTAKELDGSGFNLHALRGKLVIVHFWATWCPACREEMPALDSFYRQYHAKGVEVIAVSADMSRKRDDVADFMKAYAFPAAMLGEVTENGFGRPEELPVTYIIGPDGTLRFKITPDAQVLTAQWLAQNAAPLLR